MWHLTLEHIEHVSQIEVLFSMYFEFLDKFKIDMFFKYKFGIEAKDYSHLAQLQNLEDVEVQTEWIIDTLYEVQETVECLFQ